MKKSFRLSQKIPLFFFALVTFVSSAPSIWPNWDLFFWSLEKTDKTEAEQTLSEQDAPSSTKLLYRDSLLSDILLLEKALTEMHPGLFRYNSPTEVKDLFKRLKDELPESIPENQFMLRLALTIRQIKCGHTYLNPWNMDKSLRSRLFGGPVYIPLGFKIINGQFFITEIAHEGSDIKRGAEIKAINNIPVKEIYTKLQGIAKTDGNNRSPIDHYLSVWNYQERHWHAFDLYLQLLYPLKEEVYTIDYQNLGESRIRSVVLPAMHKKERAQKMSAIYGEEILQQKQWRLEFPSENLAVMKLGTFAIWNWKGFDHKSWLGQAFKQLDSMKIQRLAIDIRGNGGGLSEPADELMSYLIDTPLNCDDMGKVLIRCTKFPGDLLPHIDTWVDALKTGLPEEIYSPALDGLYELKLPSDCEDLKPQTPHYKGQVFILGDASNVSATFTLLKKAKQFGFARYIGETSGGNLQGINGGEYAFFTMPYCKMEVDIPLKFFAPKEPQPDAGLQPQIVINTTQKDIAQNRDPYLEYLMMEN